MIKLEIVNDTVSLQQFSLKESAAETLCPNVCRKSSLLFNFCSKYSFLCNIDSDSRDYIVLGLLMYIVQKMQRRKHKLGCYLQYKNPV